LKAVKGENGIIEPTFIYLDGVPGGDAILKATGCEFFSVPVELGVSFLINIHQFSQNFPINVLDL
jgi:malate dehydrogenase